MKKTNLKATAVAPANIAFIKYWGQKNSSLSLPFNDSISMNLDNCFTTTTVEFSPRYKKDEIFIDNQKVNGNEIKRIIKHMDKIRKLSVNKLYAKIASVNSFPKSSGIASSASGFAALTLAATRALGLNLSSKAISVLARQGSGSAVRSIPDGFSYWNQGTESSDSYAFSIASSHWWNIKDIVVIVSEDKKETSSLEGHAKAVTSPYFSLRLEKLPERILKIKKAIKEKNFKLLGETIEEETNDMHAITLTSKPSIIYWSAKTLEIIDKIKLWRKEGLFSYYTIDAGPNLHIICEARREKTLTKKLKAIPGVLNIIINSSGRGARLINNHLF